MRTLLQSLALSAFVLASCGHPPDGSTETGSSPPHASPASPLGSAGARASAPPSSATAPAAEPSAPFTNGARAFESVKEALLHHYAGKELTDDQLYRAALQGMLEHADPARTAWNKLLSPAELEAMHADLRGEVVGIGAQIHFDEASGYTDVLGVFPGSPAEKAGLLGGDKILAVGGKLYKGKTLKDVLGDIRGKAGDPVTLAVLREDKVSSLTVTRGVVAYEVVETMELPDATGYLRVRSFNAKTRPAIDQAMDGLSARGVRRLVVDLRENPGGAFDEAVASAEAFLPSGVPIVRSDKPGGKEEIFTSKGSPKLASVPLAVLVDHETASGGEVLAAALEEGRAATIVGTRTFGKWSVQMIDDLPNGYAVKYTVGMLRSGAGRALDGVGLLPDVEVDMEAPAIAAALAVTDPGRRPLVDTQLRTAVALLREK
jgi:carboxyl-terminal processing protease